jgi:metallo-beta-lactamase family protein
MQITFHGAAQTVTGSQHLLSLNGTHVLLDCGLYQGSRKEAEFRNRTFLHDPAQLDAVVLSHAHIDHSGLLPMLVRKGFKGPIYATAATQDLCRYMLLDSGHIQEADAEYLNRRARKRGQPADFEPLYTQADAEAALKLFRGVRYKTPTAVAPGLEATFIDAGHILGSASVVLDVKERAGLGTRSYRLAFSGDIGRMNLPILRDPVLLAGRDVDYAIMEATYGGRDHRPPDAAFAELTEVVKATVARGGKIIIPSFAVGRAQELIYELNRLIQAGEIPPLPVYVDSPLATNVSEVFSEHQDLYDEETLAFMRETRTRAFAFSSLHYTRSVEESKAINEMKGPLVVISASGMAESGRILHHLRNNIEDPRNTILIVSWQAPNTLGRRLAEHDPEVRIFGDAYKVRAQVATINGYSGHAGHDLLVRWATALKPSVKQIFLVHGEPESLVALRQSLNQNGLPNVHDPQLHETVEIG